MYVEPRCALKFGRANCVLVSKRPRHWLGWTFFGISLAPVLQKELRLPVSDWKTAARTSMLAASLANCDRLQRVAVRCRQACGRERT